ncbi:MAG TPA: glycosyltransferase family 9 protein [Albitalea sp.]|uniref:glycosyltransferase family 9 protein n=1 Tax=Piscinibacter sp. TaxID=1903157 RepID=UPI002ED05289
MIDEPTPDWRDEPAPQRIAVFRALVLGDMLCAVPALRALRHGWPQAELTLIGLPWASELAERLPMIDRFIEFPGYPGLPESMADIAALPAFLQRMQHERFDLLLQMHGSGRITNPLMAACGARHTGGFVEPGSFAPEPQLFVPWPSQGHEIERLLALTDSLGLRRCGTHLEFPLNDTDRIELASLWPGAYGGQPYACLHAGAQLPSRRWPAERFAAVADSLAERGLAVVLTGTSGEAALVSRVERAMTHPAVNLAGKTPLWTLGALIEHARVLVCNDTGVSHIASALGTRSVVVSAGADVTRWAPPDHDLHPVLWQLTPCRPCSFARCPYDHECAKAITPQMVVEATHTTDVLEPADA